MFAASEPILKCILYVALVLVAVTTYGIAIVQSVFPQL